MRHGSAEEVPALSDKELQVLAPFSLLMDIGCNDSFAYFELHDVLDVANNSRYSQKTIARLTNNLLDFEESCDIAGKNMQPLPGHPISELSRRAVEVEPGHGVTFNDPNFLVEHWASYQDHVGNTLQRVIGRIMVSLLDVDIDQINENLTNFNSLQETH